MELERRIRDETRRWEKELVNPTMLFHFYPGQQVMRRTRPFSKLDAKATGPFKVRKVSGLYRQRVTIEPEEGSSRRRPLAVHAS